MVLSIYSLLRYYSFRTLYFDLGIFSSSMSQVLHGTQGIQTLILPSTPGHVGHFSPVLVIPLGLYALLPSPATLLVFQTVLLALAALPLFELALEVTHRTPLSLAIAIAYLLYPALQGANRYDFHVESFVPLFAFVAGLAVARARFGLFVVAALLLLCTHEYLSIVFLWTGGVTLAYQLLRHRRTVLNGVDRRWSATAAGLGAAFLALEELLNLLLTPSHASVFAWLSTTTANYSGGPAAILAGAGVDLSVKLLYWLLLLVPLLFLPLRDWRLLLPAVPWLGVTIVASNRGIYSVYSQYSALVLPFLFVAAVWALRRPSPFPWASPRPHQVVAALLAVGLIATATVGPLSPLNSYDGLLSDGFAPPYPPAVTAHDQGTARILGLIPDNASVLAQNELFSQVSDRAEVAPYWNATSGPPPGYIAIDAGRTWFEAPLSPYPTNLSGLVSQLLSTHPYGIVGFSGSAVVYGFGQTAPPSVSRVAASLPNSSAAFATGWSVAGGSAALGAQGLHLAPTDNATAIAWTATAVSDGLLVRADLAWSPPGAGAWSGVTFGFPGRADLEVLAVFPGFGEVAWLRGVPGSWMVETLGAFSAGRNTTHLEVVRSGSALQAWVDGRFIRLRTGLPAATISDVGIATAGENLTVSSLVGYESEAAVPPPGGAIPWDGIDAGLLIILPVMAILLVEPVPSRLVGRIAAALRRRISGRP